MESLESRHLLATVTWVGNGDGVSWFDASNWDVNGVSQLPTAADDVVISLPGETPTINFQGGSQIVASLMADATLNVNSGTLTIRGPGQIAHLGIAEATLIADGTLAGITADAVDSIDRSTLRALGGGNISLPATSYSGASNNNTRFLASGANSRIDLPNLTTLAGGSFISTLFVEAENGGTINLGNLSAITGNATQLLAREANSLINVSSLTTFVDTNGNRSSLIEEQNGGVITASNLTTLSAVNINLNASSTLATGQITSYTDGVLQVQGIAADFSSTTEFTNATVVLSSGGTVNLDNITSINGASFEVRDGVELTIPNAVSYSGQSNSNTRFKSVGNGSMLKFPQLITLAGGSFISTFLIQAEGGGSIDHSSLNTITGGATQVTATGADSQVDLSNLTSFHDSNGNRESLIRETTGGVISAPYLTSANAVTLYLDAQTTISTTQLEQYTNGNINVHSIHANLPGLVNISGTQLRLTGGATANVDTVQTIHSASFVVEDGVTLNLPQPTTYTGSSNDATYFRATGAGSRLILNNLTEVSGSNFIGDLRVEALNGGVVDLNAVTTAPAGRTTIIADGASSRVELNQVNSINLGGSRQASITALNGGTVRLSDNLIDANRLTITATATGSIQAGTIQLRELGEVRGAGTLDFSLINAGQIFPGNAIGEIIVNGSFTQLPAGRLHIQLGGINPVSGHDRLVVLGPASLGGTVNISLTAGFVPGERDGFEVLTFATGIGSFSILNGTSLSNGLVLDPQMTSQSFTLRSLPRLSLADVEVLEGDVGVTQAVFNVSLSTSVGYDLSVDYQTWDHLAVAGSDYAYTAETLILPAGSDTAQIVVSVFGDLALERDEKFFVRLENPVDVALGNVQAVGTILNDDTIPAIDIMDVVSREPAVGSIPFEFEVTLSAPAPDPVLFSFFTVDGTATAGSDYLATAGTLSFEASASRGRVSDGSHGAFHPTSNTTLTLPPDGVFHFTSIHIPTGVTVQFARNATNTPAILLASGDVRIDGTIHVSASGRIAGAGGGDGGISGVGIVDGTDGLGLSPGTGGGAMDGFVGSGGGGGGMATDGLSPTRWVGPLPGSGGPAIDLPLELDDRGGSGGGGGGGWFRFAALSGGNGGGAGGGLIVSSSAGSIMVNGTIRANGANGGTAFANAFGWGGPGGGGSGGVIDLQADSIVINGTLEALGGKGGGISTVSVNDPNFSSGANGGDGYIRLSSDELEISGLLRGELITRDLGMRQVIRVEVLADEPGEPDETFFVQLTQALNAFLADDLAVGTIQDWNAAPGDFNGDGLFNGDDIDALVAAIASGNPSLLFDLNSDGTVNLADRDLWLALAGAANLSSGAPYRLGDANLDGVVDGQDFIVWNQHKFTNVAAWTSGDFNADGFVDGQDFIIWNGNKFTSAILPQAPAFGWSVSSTSQAFGKPEGPASARDGLERYDGLDRKTIFDVHGARDEYFARQQDAVLKINRATRSAALSRRVTELQKWPKWDSLARNALELDHASRHGTWQ